MKKKHLLILLFMVIFAGVSLLGYSQALAADYLSPCATLSMEQGPNGDPDCLDFPWTVGGDNYPGYVLAYRGYLAGVHDFELYKRPDVGKGIYNPPTPSYLVIKVISGIETIPTNSGISLTDLFKTCPAVGVYTPYEARKLNPKFKGGSATVQMFGGLDRDACGFVWLIVSDQCKSGSIALAKVFDVPPLANIERTCFDGVTVKVVPAECGNDHPEVSCIYPNGSISIQQPTPNPWIVTEEINSGKRLAFQPRFFGVDPGGVLCTVLPDDPEVSAFPAFITGGDLYLCPAPSP